MTELIEFPAQAEKTLTAFFTAMAAELGDAHKELLNDLARALSERGWVQPVEQVVARLGDMSSPGKVRDALAELERRRLVTLDGARKQFTGLLGCISVAPTEHRGHLASGVDVYTFGGMDLLTLSAMFLKPVDCFTKCPTSGAELTLRIEGDQIVETNVTGIAAYRASWDGRGPLEELSARSPLFASDAAMESWQASNPSVDGMALPGDLMLWVGMSAAQEVAAARFELIGHRE